jgi:hypothetical protein
MASLFAFLFRSLYLAFYSNFFPFFSFRFVFYFKLFSSSRFEKQVFTRECLLSPVQRLLCGHLERFIDSFVAAIRAKGVACAVDDIFVGYHSDSLGSLLLALSSPHSMRMMSLRWNLFYVVFRFNLCDWFLFFFSLRLLVSDSPIFSHCRNGPTALARVHPGAGLALPARVHYPLPTLHLGCQPERVP